jgi:hypothetical protein
MNDAGVRPSDVDLRLAFFQKLQTVTTKIHATSNLDEIMLDLGMEFCDLFNCDRFTLYALDTQKDHIVSKVKTGLTSFRDLKLAITPASIAGYVALTRKTVNIADVYDQNELGRYSPELRFQQGVDQRTGYRTKQMLVAPLISVQSRELLGVVQFINNRDRVPFSTIAEDGVKELCETLSVAFSQRMKPPQMVRTKYDGLVTEAVISAHELEAATRSSRAKAIDIEDVLVDEYEIKPAAIGVSLEKHFGVPYEHFRPDRLKPVDLLKNLKRQYVEESGWIPLEDSKEGLLVAALDPERVAHTHIVEQIFPRAKPVYRVTSHREFRQMVELFFGHGDNASVGDLLSGMDDVYDEDGEGSGEVSEAVENEPGQAAQQNHHGCVPAGRVGHPYRTTAGQGQDRHPLPQGWLAGAVHRDSGQLPCGAGGAREDHVRPRHLRAPQAAGRQDQVQKVWAFGYRVAGSDHTVIGWRGRYRDANSGRRRAHPVGQAGRAAVQP